MFLSLYIQTTLKRNTKSDKRILKEDDIVIILDRLTRGLENTLAEVVETDESNKNIIVRTISRPAIMDANFNIRTPARISRLLRAPESLIFLFRKNTEIDILEYFNTNDFSANQRWTFLEDGTDQDPTAGPPVPQHGST